MSTATITAPVLDACLALNSVEQSVAFSCLKEPQKFVVKFSEIKVYECSFELNRPLEFTLEKVGEGWTCEQPTFSLFAFGVKNTEAVCSCFEDFAVLWDEIAQAPDDALAEGAQRTKRALLGIVKSVTTS